MEYVGQLLVGCLLVDVALAPSVVPGFLMVGSGMGHLHGTVSGTQHWLLVPLVTTVSRYCCNYLIEILFSLKNGPCATGLTCCNGQCASSSSPCVATTPAPTTAGQSGKWGFFLSVCLVCWINYNALKNDVQVPQATLVNFMLKNKPREFLNFYLK